MNNESPDYIYKQQLLSTGVFRSQSRDRYTCQCPFCNDNKRHMYVLIKFDETPLLYHCFKCNSNGIVNKLFLEYLGIENIKIPRTNKTFRKRIDLTKVNQNILTVDEHIDISFVCNYIERKIGERPSLQELQFFQYIGDPYKYSCEYLNHNKDDRMFKYRHWFRLTNGNIIGRHDKDGMSISWLKYSGDQDKSNGLYTIKLPFDLYKPINVYIAEGVMDVIGLYYHYIRENTIYIACLGKSYDAGIRYLINMGIFGDNVNIKIFKDSDVNKRDIKINDNIKKLFNDISIYQNINGKDYGLPSEQIEIQKCIK